MQNKFKNPAIDLIEKQERILRAYNNPALEMQNYASKFLAGINNDRIYEIERMAQKMCMPQPLMDALDTFNRTISITTGRDFMGINKFAETLQKELAAVREPMFQLSEINFSDWNSPIMNDITSMAASMNTALDPLIKSLSVYNTPAFTESLFSSAVAIDSALVNSFEHLHSIIEYFPDEAEQAFSENPLDMFSEEFYDLDNNDDSPSKFEAIQEKLNTLTFSDKVKYLLKTLEIFLTLLTFIAAGSKLDVSFDYSNHVERVIVGDTIQETSDTDLSFDLSYGEQENPENEELIAYIESLSQQIDKLTEMVSELEKQENSDCCECECCDNY